MGSAECPASFFLKKEEKWVFCSHLSLQRSYEGMFLKHNPLWNRDENRSIQKPNLLVLTFK